MKTVTALLLSALCLAVFATTTSQAQQNGGIDPEALIERVLAVEHRQQAMLEDVVFDAEYVEREEDDGEYKEKLRIVKKVYIKYLEDTTLYKEEFLELYKDGERKSEKDLRNEYKDRMEKKEKRKGRDVSYPMLKPFWPEYRPLYDISYQGVSDERIEGYVCHHFRVDAKEEVDTLLNGDYYFEAGAFHLVRVDFSPAKLVKKTMFRMKELNMTIVYGSTSDDIWVPERFDVQGKGKAALFFGVNFAGTEYYRDPEVNVGLDDDLFLENEEEE
ncbi:hypothetical protein GF377_03550 [candidate division GN15 bacterium]|nr:hypothetical protein [candidate division GN15 bacterium]